MILEILIVMALLFVFAVFALALCSFVLIQIWKTLGRLIVLLKEKRQSK